MIDQFSCGSESVTELDLSRYPKLKTLRIGDYSFVYVNVTKLIGMSELESVVIGKLGFYRYFGTFYLKDCPKLKSLRIGSGSFQLYLLMEIENVDALEVIEIGESVGVFPCFQYIVALELKSYHIS